MSLDSHGRSSPDSVPYIPSAVVQCSLDCAPALHGAYSMSSLYQILGTVLDLLLAGYLWPILGDVME